MSNWDDPWSASAPATAPAPWAPLSRRIAGLGPDDTVHDGIPSYMRGALTDWVDTIYAVAGNDRDVDRLDNTLRLRLRWDSIPPSDTLSDEQLLDVIDAVLRWWGMRPALRNEIIDMLTAGGAGWRVTPDGQALERRVDETVTEAVAHTILTAMGVASDHLKTAWRATYERHPDPDKAYAEAVKAVEAVACPLVLEKKTAQGNAILSDVIGVLKSPHGGAKWELLFTDRQDTPAAVGPVVAMMGLLMQGHRSRHSGGPASRRQTQAEAEAAVHLAATLVQWLSSDVLRKKR